MDTLPRPIPANKKAAKITGTGGTNVIVKKDNGINAEKHTIVLWRPITPATVGNKKLANKLPIANAERKLPAML